MTDGMTPGQRDAFNRTQSGLFVPNAEGQAEAGDVLEARMVQMLVDEINAVTAWCRKWPKTNEKALGGGDVMDLCLARARSFMWSRDFTEQVYRGAAINLGLVKRVEPAPPGSRAARRQEKFGRGRAGERPNLRTVPDPERPTTAREEFDPSYGIASPREASRGYAEFNEQAVADEATNLQQAEPFTADQQPATPVEHEHQQFYRDGSDHVS